MYDRRRVLSIAVNNGFPWPDKETPVKFEGRNLILRPPFEEFPPSIVFELDSTINESKSLSLVRRFMSVLSWVENTYLREIEYSFGGSAIYVSGVEKRKYNLLTSDYFIDFLPEPSDPKKQLALALYREALSANSIPYRFLGFFKIINILYKDGPAQIKWINDIVEDITDDSLKSIIRNINKIIEKDSIYYNIGDYLYSSGRCAIAHAYNEPLINPDVSGDIEQLSLELPLIIYLARYMIKEEMKITDSKHFDMLQGFSEILGNDLIKKIKEGENVSISEMPSFEKINIRIRGRKQLNSLKCMQTQVLEIKKNLILLSCSTAQKKLMLFLIVNLDKGQLEFDPFVFVEKEETSEEFIREKCDCITLTIDLLHNKQLEVWNSKDNKFLGRSTHYIPTNINSVSTIDKLNKKLALLKNQLK